MFHELWEFNKVSTGKSDLQGHLMLPFDRPHTISYQCSIATLSLSYTINQILSLISQNFKRSPEPEHVSFSGNISRMY